MKAACTHVVLGWHVLAQVHQVPLHNQGFMKERLGRKPNMVLGRTPSVALTSALLVRELHTLQATVGADRGGSW
jgi:hypothetical protein